MYKFWTTEENDIIKANFGKMSMREITKRFLSHRTEGAVKMHANKRLKLKDSEYRFRQYTCDENFWETPNEINSYYSGILAGDGNIRGSGKNREIRWQISQVDKKHMEDFVKHIKFTGPIHYYDRKPLKSGHIVKVAALGVHSLKWARDLERNFNIVPCKTKIILPPNIIDEKLLACYIKGYLDADGWLTISTQTDKRTTPNKMRKVFSIGVVSSSLKIIEWMKHFIDSQTISYSPRHKEPQIFKKDKYSTYIVAGQRAIKLFLYLSRLNVPCLERKWKNPAVLAHIREKITEKPKLYASFIDPIAHSFLLETPKSEPAEVNSPDLTH